MDHLLSALESISQAYVDRGEALLLAMRGGGKDSADTLANILEHGVRTLDTLSLSSPRRERTKFDELCSQMEEILASLPDGQVVAELSNCRESDLTLVAEALREVEALSPEHKAGTENEGSTLAGTNQAREGAVSTVIDALATLIKYSNPRRTMEQLVVPGFGGTRAKVLTEALDAAAGSVRGLPKAPHHA